ncbi:WD40 repeat domain-containing protein [Candidatus Dependentiae bacterium]
MNNTSNKLSSIAKFCIFVFCLSFSGSIFSMDKVGKISVNNFISQELSYKKIVSKLLSLSSKDLYKLISGDLKTTTGELFTTINTNFNNESDRHFMYLIREEVKKKKPEIFNLELLRKTFHNKTNVIYSKFSPDSKFLLTTSLDGKVKLLDTNTWNSKKIFSYTGKIDEGFLCDDLFVYLAIFSPDSKFLLVALTDGEVKLLNINIGSSKTIFKSDYNILSSVFSPNGKFLLTSAKTAKLWDTNTWIKKQTFAYDFGIKSVLFSPDSKFLLTNSINGTAKLWDTNTGLLKQTFKHDDRVLSAVFSYDGKFVLTASQDGIVKLWDINTGILKNIFKHNYSVLSAVFSPNGKFILTTLDNKTKLWDIETGILKKTIYHDKCCVLSSGFFPGGKFIFTISLYDVKLWDIETWTLNKTINCDGDSDHLVEISPDGKFILILPIFGIKAEILQISTKKSLHNLYSFKEILFLLLLSKEKSKLFKSKYCTKSFKDQALKIVENIDTSPLFSKEENKRLKKEGFIRKSICKKYNFLA